VPGRGAQSPLESVKTLQGVFRPHWVLSPPPPWRRKKLSEFPSKPLERLKPIGQFFCDNSRDLRKCLLPVEKDWLEEYPFFCFFLESIDLDSTIHSDKISSDGLSWNLSFFLFFYLSIYLSIYPFFYPSIYFYIFLYFIYLSRRIWMINLYYSIHTEWDLYLKRSFP